MASLADAQQQLIRASALPPGQHNPAVIDRMSRFMAAIGNPQDELRIVHIAGTSGKTSTAHYVSALLSAAGKRVGLSISPYTYALNDRLQLNGEPLEEQVFCDALHEFLALYQKAGVGLAYLELLTAFAFWQLRRMEVDYAVIETNAGGLFDATNVATRADKVAVITDIGFDHVSLLGYTLVEIAAKKAGIIHQNNLALMLRQPAEVTEVMQARATKQKARLAIIDDQPIQPQQAALTHLPLFQRRNWWLAKCVYDRIAKRDKLPTLTDDELRRTMITVPGRMEKVRHRGVELILDVGHNPQKLKGTVESVRDLYPGQAVAVLVMIGDGKEQQPMLAELLQLKPYLICSEYSYIEGLPHQATPATQLAGIANKLGFQAVIAEPDNTHALQLLLDRPEPVKLITGSLYGISQLKQIIDKPQDPPFR